MNTAGSQQRRAVIYTRVSSDEQTKGYGLEYQLEDCRRAIAQQGHELTHVYSDPGISGTLEDRPGLNQLRRDAHERRFDILYFWKSDRLARDEILQLTLYREFRRLGIETYSVSEPDMNDLMRGIYAVFGAEDLRNIKAKTFSGRLRAMRAGKWIGAPPYGYMKDAAYRLLPNPQEAPWVKQLFEWLVADSLSLYALTKRAYAQHVPTWCDTRGRRKRVNGPTYWSVGTLANLLKRDYYATGQAPFTVRPALSQISGPRTASAATETIMVSIPPLVSQDLFQRAQKQLRQNVEYSPRASKHVYLFAKKVRCGSCGLRLTGTLGRVDRVTRYYKPNPINRQQRCGHCGCTAERLIDDALWPRIVAFFKEPEAFMASLEVYRTRGTALPQIKADEAALEVTATKLQEQEKALLACEVERFYAPNVLADKKRQIEIRRRELEERRIELQRRSLAEEKRFAMTASARSLYEAIRHKLEAPTYSTKAEIYRILIEKIILNGDKAEVWLNVPLMDQPPSKHERSAVSNMTEEPASEADSSAALLTHAQFVEYDAIAQPRSGVEINRLLGRSHNGLVVFDTQLRKRSPPIHYP